MELEIQEGTGAVRVTFQCGHADWVSGWFFDVQDKAGEMARLGRQSCPACDPDRYRPIGPGPTVYTDPNGGRVEIWGES